MSKKIIIAAAVLVGIVLLGAGIRWFIHARSTSSMSDCSINLRQLDSIKQQWALEHKKTPDDMPNWNDLQPYLRSWLKEVGQDRPICPGGGEYTLGRIRDTPTCSIGTGTHVLAQ